MLLSRVADHLYWGARYLERADGTARVVRSFTEVIIDLPVTLTTSWEPLLAVAGEREQFDAGHARAGEHDVVRFLVADPSNRGSVVGSIAAARDNLRTTREILPREAWQTINDLYLYVGSNGSDGVGRRSRARFLNRVIADCQRFDGVLSASMSRDSAYELWRLGQSIERADMTTRVLGVRAAALLAPAALPAEHRHDTVQWMGVLRSVSALQMYQRSSRGPIDPISVVRFLLLDTSFPRSVAGCVKRIRAALERLPHGATTMPAVDSVERSLVRLAERPPDGSTDGTELDAAMEAVQVDLAALSQRVIAAFVRGAP